MPHALAVDTEPAPPATAVSSPLARAREEGRLGPLVGASPSMLEVYGKLCRVAPTDATVLLTGEGGTGKELAATAVHQLGRQAAGPFVVVSCAAAGPEQVEAELFGHEGTGFSGRPQRSCFERAQGGTLVLDEVVELPCPAQARLLRVLESGELGRAGAEPPVAVDARVIATTRHDLREAVAGGRLREDLFYRLAVFPVELPPLRERGDDLQLLCGHFLAAHRRRHGAGQGFTGEAMERLRAHPWPGNVRELRHVVHRAHLSSDGEEIGPECLPEEIAGRPSAGRSLCFRVGTSIADVERELILATLDCHDGNKRKTAEVLGVSLKTLYNRLNAYKDATAG